MNIFKKLHSKKSRKAAQKHRGFTLIELIVSLGLFTVVVSISGSAMYTMAETSRTVQSIQLTMDNLSLAMEDMSRTMRTGSRYFCNPTLPFTGSSQGNNCSVPNDSVGFVSASGERVVYRLSSARLEKSVDGGNNFIPVTDQKLAIGNLSFYVLGAVGGTDQPRTIVSMTATAGNPASGGSSTFTLQTSVTQRSPK